MDPFAFATLISLITQFKGESTNYGLEDLKRWVEAKDFKNVSDIINNNDQVRDSIQGILSMNYDQLKDQLKEIEGQIARLTAGSGAIGHLAASLRPEALLSDGASELIVNIVNAKANDTGYILAQSLDGLMFEVEFDEDFILSDLNELIDAGFLQHRNYSSETEFNVVYTRSAETYVKNLQKNKGNS